MSTVNYKSDNIYKTAVLHYYGFSWVASMFTLIPLGVIGVVSGMDGIVLMMMLIVGQNIQWIVLGSVLCANFRVMANPYNPPTPQVTSVKSQTNVRGNSEVTEIERIKTIERQ